EVERSDRDDEALERPVLEAVPHLRARLRLLPLDLVEVVDVEAPEVDQLARRVDLGLEDRLALPEHRRGVELGAPRAGEQLRGLEEDRRARLEGRLAPALPRRVRRRDRALDLLRPALVVLAEDVAMV